jgi:nitroreductase
VLFEAIEPVDQQVITPIFLRKDLPTVNTIEAIARRRSIRKFKSTPIPDEALRAILTAGMQAPSGKNRQPWCFYVVREDKRAEMLRILREGIAKEKAEGEDPGSSEWTANVMEQAPVTVFIFNPAGVRPWLAHSIGQNYDAVVDTQSIGAAIENMLLAALDQGIGSLWICDVFYAYEGLCEWLNAKGAMIAAVAFGYPDESPAVRWRKAFDEVVKFV